MSYHRQLFIKFILIFIAIFALSSCGFKPFYAAKNKHIHQLLSSITPEPIDTPEGAEYYEAIYDILRPSSLPKYSLKTSIAFSKGIAILQANSDVLRENTTAAVSFKLIEIDSAKIIHSGAFNESVSYSTTFAPYPNTVRADDSRVRVAKDIAEEIRNRLILYFTNNHETL